MEQNTKSPAELLDQTYGMKKFKVYADYVADQVSDMSIGEKRTCSTWNKTFADFRMTLSHISGRELSHKTRTLRESMSDEVAVNFGEDYRRKPEHKSGVIYVMRIK